MGYYQDILFEGADKDFPNLQIENAHPFVRLTFNDNNGARLYSLRNDNVVRLADGSEFFIPLFQNNGPLEENQAHVFQRNGFLQLSDHYQGDMSSKSMLFRLGVAPRDESAQAAGNKTEPNDLLRLKLGPYAKKR